MSKRPIIISSTLLLLLFVAGALLYRHAASGNAATTATAQGSSRASTATSCVDFVKNRTPGTDTGAMQAHARQLAEASHFDQALVQYRELAVADPGFPGVNLEISRMLLKLNQPRLAKQAINTQIAVSECLPNLQLDSMDEYCKSENFPATLVCMKELNSGQESAYVQAALVQTELGRALSPRLEANASTSALHPVVRPVHATPAPTKPVHTLLAFQATPGEPKIKPAGHPNPNQLAAGTGTDAALGAYSK